MNAEEVMADQTGSNVPSDPVATPYRQCEGEWGHLHGEPCRFCGAVGQVFFECTEGWEGHLDDQSDVL